MQDPANSQECECNHLSVFGIIYVSFIILLQLSLLALINLLSMPAKTQLATDLSYLVVVEWHV